MEKNKKVENIMRDTRRDIRYIILASRKLSREEILLHSIYITYLLNIYYQLQLLFLHLLFLQEN